MRPQRRLTRQIESLPRCARQRIRKARLGDTLDRKPRPRRRCLEDLLPRHPIAVREDRAQALVPPDHVPQRGFQRTAVQLTPQPHRQRDHVGGAAPFQPVQEPQPPLRIRQRDLIRPRQRYECRPRRLAFAHTLRQTLHGRRLEQAADRKLHIQGRADPADQPRRQQRMAAEREEVVVDPHALEPQHLRKQRAQHLLARRARPAHDRRGQIGRRQRTPVELAVRRQRQPLQHHKGRRHHVVRQARRHMRPQRRRIGCLHRRAATT